jgi:uncharacterized protein YjbI with pentapeptide repeats
LQVSDQSQRAAGAEPTKPRPGAWGQPISDARRAELDALAEQQLDWIEEPTETRGDSLFSDVKLTGADVFWLAVRAVAGFDATPETLAHVADLIATADLEDVPLDLLSLAEANLGNARLERATLTQAHLESANLHAAHLQGADLRDIHLERAHLLHTRLQGAYLSSARLEGATLSGAELQRADLSGAHLEGADLIDAHLEGADLRLAKLDKSSSLHGAFLNGARLDQVSFDNTNLTVVEWRAVERLGDELAAQQDKTLSPSLKAAQYHTAARAYRALATALRTQGLSAEATRFHYRGELMARYESLYDFLARLFSRRFYTAPAAFGRWFVSWLLGTLAGYGDRLDRLFLTYALVVSAFAGLMFLVAGRPPSVDSIRDVYVLSITSFHGRGLQPPGLPLTDALATLAAIEAFFGLTIEGIFIAAFTRRVTGG